MRRAPGLCDLSHRNAFLKPNAQKIAPAARGFVEDKGAQNGSEISMRTWLSPMSAASQGAFADMPQISPRDIFLDNKSKHSAREAPLLRRRLI